MKKMSLLTSANDNLSITCVNYFSVHCAEYICSTKPSHSSASACKGRGGGYCLDMCMKGDQNSAANIASSIAPTTSYTCDIHHPKKSHNYKPAIILGRCDLTFHCNNSLFAQITSHTCVIYSTQTYKHNF
jgi:hypothetical protein